MFFTEEFEKAQEVIKGRTFNKDWLKLVGDLKKVFSVDGPSDNGASALSDLRKRVLEGESQGVFKGPKKLTDEAEGILSATGDYDHAKPTALSAINDATRDKAAALKLLRHLYLLRKRGSHKVWICSLPASMAAWPSKELAGADVAKLRSRLSDVSQRFSEEDKKNLSDATQEAMKWVQKALILLANAASKKDKSASKEKALTVVKRWFDDGSSTPEQLNLLIGDLQAGFKKIAAKLGSGHLVMTDHPEYRGQSLENSEAFVWALPNREKIEVVYIESQFFGNNNLLKGLKNWTRILVHEMTHLDVGTQDKFYAWEGIKPGPGFSFADASVNAESWAFFCADAGGALTEGDRTSALK